MNRSQDSMARSYLIKKDVKAVDYHHLQKLHVLIVVDMCRISHLL